MRRNTRLPLRFDTLEDRLTPALALDPSFGIEGRTFITPGTVPLYGTISDVAVRPDGKIWAVGALGNNPVVARFNANGELDATFDGDGILPILSWSNSVSSFSLSQIAIQADGKIVVGGSTSQNNTGPVRGADLSIFPYPYYGTNTDLLAMRLNADGTLDTSFGTEGRATIDLDGSNSNFASNLLDLRILSNGGIALAANEFIPIYPAYATADTTGNSTPPGVSGLSIAPTPTTPSFVGVRLTADGKLDTSYDTDGIANIRDDAVIQNFYSGNGNGGAAILADGGVVFSVTRTTPYTSPQSSPQELYAGVFRLTADGARDASFDGDGYAETLIETVAVPDGGSASVSGFSNRIQVQSDGRVLVGLQYSTYSANADYQQNVNRSAGIIARFTVAGQRDAAFGDNGTRTVFSISNPTDGTGAVYPTLQDLVVLPNDRIATLTATSKYDVSQYTTTTEIQQFTANGQIDNSTASYTIPVSSVAGENLNPIRIVANGDKLLIVGSTDFTQNTGGRIGLIQLANDPPAVPPTANNQNVVGRFISKTGTPLINLDPDFGGGAPVFLSTDLGPIIGYANSTLIQPDGKILVFGNLSGTSVIARFNTNGTLDTSFDGDGVRSLTPASNEQSIFAGQYSLQADGKIVIAGTVQLQSGSPAVSGGQQTFVMRLNANGSTDTTFAGGRVVFEQLATQPVNLYPNVIEVAVLANGQIQLVSSQTDYAGDTPSTKFLIRRLNADGTADSSYDGDGVAVIDDPRNINLHGGTNPATILPDGSVVLAGSYTTPTVAPFNDRSSTHLSLYRIAANGTLDTSFDSDGYAELLLGTNSTVNDITTFTSAYVPPLVVIQPDGKIVLGVPISTTTNGFTTNPDGTTTSTSSTTNRFELRRFNANGSLDTTFGTNGVTVLDESNNSNSNENINRGYTSIIQLPDGSFSLMSSTNRYSNVYPLYLASGAPSSPPSVDYVGNVIAPSIQNTTTILRRLTPNGLPDLTYGLGGIFTIATQETELQPATQTLDANGQIVLSGTSGRLGLGVERISTGAPSLPSNEPTIYVSGPNGTVEAFQRNAAGNLVSAGTFTPFAGYTGTVRVATGDLNGDGFTDTIFSTGDSGSKVSILLGQDPDQLHIALFAPITFTAFEESFDGGVSVSVGDIDGDGIDEFVVAPNVTGSGRVIVYSLVNGQPVVRANFFGIVDLNFRGGATCTLGDMNGDGKMELIVAAGVGGGPRIAIFDGATLFSVAAGLQPPKMGNDFFAFPGEDAARLRNGATVAAGDINGDGADDLVFGGGPGGGPRVYAIDGKAMTLGNTVSLANFFVEGDETSRDGVRFALKDMDNDGRAELVTTSHGNRVRVYGGTNLTQENAVEPGMIDDFESSIFMGVATSIYVG